MASEDYDITLGRACQVLLRIIMSYFKPVFFRQLGCAGAVIPDAAIPANFLISDKLAQ
jgi:hypothetical protein